MFRLIKIDNARMNVPEPEYYECEEDIKCGWALAQLEGKLRPASESDVKEFIAMADGKAGETIPVCRISKEQVWESHIVSDSERIWAEAIPGATVYTEQYGICTTSINAKNSDAIIVSKGEPDSFWEDGGVTYATGGPVRIRFLCNFGRDATDNKQPA